MSMTLDEMKLAVCEKLTDVISMIPFKEGYLPWVQWKKTGRDVYWPTEGLHVCHEAEKLLQPVGCGKTRYEQELKRVVNAKPEHKQYWIQHATYEQRLEALCRVWFPERFQL